MKLNTFRWFDDTSIGTRLGGGFGLLLLILIGYGVFSIREMQLLAALGDAIYERPMTSGHAIRDANIAILKMHRAVLHVPQADDTRLENLERVVEENRVIVEASFRILRTSFLGSKETLRSMEHSLGRRVSGAHERGRR